MLKKANRLAKSKDIQQTFARGRTFFTPFFTVKFLRRPAGRRLTVVVSTKVFKNATARNRLKRITRELLRRRLPDLPAGDYVIGYKPAAAKQAEAGLLQTLNTTLAAIR
ncbi:MAG TPA: ribonuclease P protein component [Patescibacteria group bacterium]|nr:ribonuclease P protein component [Patescibacteria group bacterium]